MDEGEEGFPRIQGVRFRRCGREKEVLLIHLSNTKEHGIVLILPGAIVAGMAIYGIIIIIAITSARFGAIELMSAITFGFLLGFSILLISLGLTEFEIRIDKRTETLTVSKNVYRKFHFKPRVVPFQDIVRVIQKQNIPGRRSTIKAISIVVRGGKDIDLIGLMVPGIDPEPLALYINDQLLDNC